MENIPFLDTGAYGIIYRLSETQCAKVIKKDNYSLTIRDDINAVKSLEKEYYLNDLLYQNGISVPKPEGISQIKIEEKNYPAFVMQYINGVYCWKIVEKKKISKMIDLELKKAEKGGFIPGEDSGIDSNNALYNYEENKVYLIDFADWKLK